MKNNNYDLQAIIKDFDKMLLDLINSGADFEISKKENSEFIEASFKILDDYYILRERNNKFDHYYSIIYKFPCPGYKEYEIMLHTYPYKPGGIFDHCNITKHSNCSTIATTMPEFQKKLNGFKEDVKRFIEVKNYEESEEYFLND